MKDVIVYMLYNPRKPWDRPESVVANTILKTWNDYQMEIKEIPYCITASADIFACMLASGPYFTHKPDSCQGKFCGRPFTLDVNLAPGEFYIFPNNTNHLAKKGPRIIFKFEEEQDEEL